MKKFDLGNNKISIVLAKGRLAKDTIEIFKKAGLDLTTTLDKSRKLIFNLYDNQVEVMFVKPTDVPIYVEHGVGDIGVCGKDTILEQDRQVYDMLDLDIAKCRLAIAGKKDFDIDKALTSNLRVATKFENIAKKYFEGREQNIEIIKLQGSIELGPLVGLSDVILDIVESGATLKENDLFVLKEITDISAHLIVNKVSLKFKPFISDFIKKLKKVI